MLDAGVSPMGPLMRLRGQERPARPCQRSRRPHRPMPGRHLIIYTRLIQDCKNANELTGVMAHEIAHMEHAHVMKKMIKESGLTLLLSIAGGNVGGEVVKGILRKISSTAYDRSLESDADEHE